MQNNEALEQDRQRAFSGKHAVQAESTAPAPRTALDLYKDPAHMSQMSFGCPVLDDIFGNGLPTHGIVEISGMAGSGKTQLMLQLLIQQFKDSEATWRAHNYDPAYVAGCSFYLSTEGGLPAKRLADMASAAQPNDSTFTQRVLESVTIAEARTVDEQLEILVNQLPAYLAELNGGIRLCIIDSMSALFRGEFQTSRTDTFDRAKLLFAMAKQMKLLSHRYQLPFVLTNQVTADLMNSDLSHPSSFNSTSSSTVQPALGLSWANCVHTRYLLTRREGRTSFAARSENINLDPPAASSSEPLPSEVAWQSGLYDTESLRGKRPPVQHSSFSRHMSLLLSPTQASGTGCRFVVETAGVRGLREVGKDMNGVR